MEIEVKSVLISIYDNWPRIRQTLNKPQKGMFRARTLGLEGWWDWSNFLALKFICKP